MFDNIRVFITWYVILQALGIIALPIAFRLFRWIPDRGYGLTKSLGLLLTSYLFWILVSFQFLRNTRIAIVFVMALIAAGAGYLAIRQHDELREALQQNKRVIITTEVLFLVGFVGWAVYRAYNPELDHTEKPMELAFLNAILRSDTFPPHDPWLAGYTISYYYFGYLMAAILTRLSGTAPAIAFNMMIALLFALTLTGAYSLTFNLVEGFRRSRRAEHASDDRPLTLSALPLSSLLLSLFGPLFVAVVGNLEGFLDVLHSRGIGAARFWAWLDVQQINTPPVAGGWIPERVWWWWRASRVITQRDPVSGNPVEIIDEFPFFSFLLGDMHPHVLSLPFVFLALAIALNMLFGTGRDEDWLPVPRLSPMALLLPLTVGTFGFLHSWDLPTYLLLVTTTYGFRRYIERGTLDIQWWRDVIMFGLWLTTLSIILFALFHIGPRPFTGGIGIVGPVKTKLRQFGVMFGLFLFIALSFLIPQMREWLNSARQHGVTREVWIIAAISLAIAGPSFLLGWWTAAALAVLVGLAVMLLFKNLQLASASVMHPTDEGETEPAFVLSFGNPVSASLIFALLLVATGLAITLTTEFVFVQDRFGTRMNTVFKLYYQAWVLLGIASAFGVYYLIQRWHGLARWGWSTGLALLLAATLVYPAVASYTRAGRFERGATLNGIAYVENYRPAEYAAIRWLQENVSGAATILEAPGDSYHADTSRISTTTGLPTLLGWGGHETQWREPVPELTQREGDIAIMYQSLDTRRVAQLLDQYHIEYVFVGPAEISKYDLSPQQINKFERIMERVFAQDDVWIYRR